MRRPRAFTSSRMRAEPLPPPARKPLGYAALNEDSWGTILRSSSPCKCGGCGLDSSASPIATPSTRLPASTSSTRATRHHAWENITFDGTPPRPEAASSRSPDLPAFTHLSQYPAARRLPLGEGTAAAAPARRIVFNSKPECCPKEVDDATTATLTITSKSNNKNSTDSSNSNSKSSSSVHGSSNSNSYGAVGGSNWSSERKRGSDGSDSGSSRGDFSTSGLCLSFGTATAKAATTATAPEATCTTQATIASAAVTTAPAAAVGPGAAAAAGSENRGVFFSSSISQTASEARTHAAAAAFASLIASPAPAPAAAGGTRSAGAAAVKEGCGGFREEDWNGLGRQGFGYGAPVEGGSVPFGGAFNKQPFVGVSAGLSPNSAGRGGSSSSCSSTRGAGGAAAARGGGGGGGGGGDGNGSNMNVDSNKRLEEWRAPETDGIFSLGAPPQPAGLGRRRRMRVGG